MTECYMTVDVEDWFQTHNLAPGIPRNTWEARESRVERNTERLLDLFDEYDVTATFFVLGWVADHYPGLVEDIDRRGHEIASHGYGHELCYEIDRDELRRDLERADDVLSALVDQPIRGYRAPAFSITDAAVEELDRLGYEYDSSSFDAMRHDRYGTINVDGEAVFAPLRGTNLTEVRLSTLRIARKHVPWAGGGWFRFIPYSLFRRGVERIASHQPFVFYLHPWEIDPEQPRIREDIPLSYRLRHYTNLGRTERRLEDLLEHFDWQALSSQFGRDRRGDPSR